AEAALARQLLAELRVTPPGGGVAGAPRRADRAAADAALARQLLAELRVTPPRRGDGGGGRPRKAGSPG
ncbi:DNA-binding protein, partial [Cupriavidus necator]